MEKVIIESFNLKEVLEEKDVYAHGGGGGTPAWTTMTPPSGYTNNNPDDLEALYRHTGLTSYSGYTGISSSSAGGCSSSYVGGGCSGGAKESDDMLIAGISGTLKDEETGLEIQGDLKIPFIDYDINENKVSVGIETPFGSINISCDLDDMSEYITNEVNEFKDATESMKQYLKDKIQKRVNELLTNNYSFS